MNIIPPQKFKTSADKIQVHNNCSGHNGGRHNLKINLQSYFHEFHISYFVLIHFRVFFVKP